MDLKSFREKTGKTQEVCAAELGITSQYFSDLECGRAPAGRKRAQQIIEWSAGQIGYDDLWPTAEKRQKAMTK